MITNDDLITIGFTPIPHFTVGCNVICDLGRDRYLSASCVGTPNEMLFISDNSNSNLVVLHNYDYDGYLTIEKVQTLVNLLKHHQRIK